MESRVDSAEFRLVLPLMARAEARGASLSGHHLSFGRFTGLYKDLGWYRAYDTVKRSFLLPEIRIEDT